MKNVFSAKSMAFGILLAGILVSTYGISIILQAARCKTWDTVKGRIIHSSAADVENSQEKKTRDVLKPYIVYEYTISGRTYFSNKISFLNFWPFSNLGDTYYTGSEDEVRDLLAKYPLDSPVVVYYNPRNAEASVLDTGLKTPVFVMFVFGLLLTYMSFHVYIYGSFFHLKDAN